MFGGLSSGERIQGSFLMTAALPNGGKADIVCSATALGDRVIFYISEIRLVATKVGSLTTTP